jgi:O-succinylhomoserine sulfhydrylase
MKYNNHGFETNAIRIQSNQTAQKEHSTPLFLTSSFTFENAEEGAALFSGEAEGNLYSRFSNPNTDEFAHKLAVLEGAEAAVATASGMNAIFTTFAALLKSGDHVVAAQAIFGNSTHILAEILPKWGIECTFIDSRNEENWELAIQPNTKMVFLETPTNPTLDLIDLYAVGQLCQNHALIFVVDNCFATPYLQRPIEYGADIVVHSATKWIDGQGRVLGGAIAGRKDLIDLCYGFIRRTGPTMSPFNAWVLSKSLETLAVHMDRHCENALAFAKVLEYHPSVERVIYPGLSSHPQYDLAKSQMKAGGGMVSVELKGGLEAGKKVLNALKVFSLTANLGDARSIATHPASTTHSKTPPGVREAVGITDGLLRFSIGLETVQDLINDFNQAVK